MFKGRIKKLRNNLEKGGINAFLISSPYNIYYLTGFKTLSASEREAFVVCTTNKTFLFTDPRHDTDLNGNLLEVKLITHQKNLTKNLQEIVGSEKIETLGFEREDLKYEEFENLSRKLKVKFKGLKNVIPKLREIKGKDEVENIKKACRLADECLKQIVPTVKVGVTEKEMSFRIEFYLKKKGCDISFLPIVAFDKNSAIPHYDTKEGDGVLKKTSVVLIDFGARVENYCSDITRMFFMRDVPTEIINLYNKLLKLQKETIRKLKDFKKAREIDKFVRNALKREGLPNFPHSTGHGIGLEVHELPSISQKSKDEIREDQVFTVEPGVYFEGKYGLRIEDIVWVKNGTPTVLTAFPKAPQILPL